MSDKKQLEQQCLDLTRDYIATFANDKTRKYINSLVPICNEDFIFAQNERPDFIANCLDTTYGVEHFMVDFCFDGPNNNQSQSKRTSSNISSIFRKYHDPDIGTIADENIDSAGKDIEEQINVLSNISRSFNYDSYVSAFRQVFERHYKNIEAYKTNINSVKVKIGFLIELHCDTSLMYAMWNGSVVDFSSHRKAFPLTKDIYELFSSAKELSFIILSQFDEGVSLEAKNVRIFDPNNMDRSVEEQNIRIYDSIFYPDIKKNISFNIKKTKDD